MRARSSILAICAILFYASRAFAQGQSISIYPPVIEVQSTPPSSPSLPIVIQNNNSEDVALRIELIPFRTNNSSGEVVLLPDEISKGFYPYYKDRIQFLIDGKKTDTVTLQALESKEIELNINLTKGDPPGDFYYSIVFISQGQKGTESNVTSIPTGIASNLLLSIGPKDVASGGISQFSTPSFKSKGPVEFTLKLHNASKHLINPTGTIEIANTFGKSVGLVKLLPQYVLSRSDRYLVDDSQSTSSAQTTTLLDVTPKVIWPEKFLFGWYKATATVQLEENGPTFKAATYFFAFPLYLFFPLVIALFVIISIIYRIRRKI